MPKNSPLFIDIGQGISVPIGQLTISFWTNLDRPVKPIKGTFGFNTDTNNLELWSGTDWYTAPLVFQKT